MDDCLWCYLPVYLSFKYLLTCKEIKHTYMCIMSHNSAICTNTVACNELNEHCKCFSLSEGILECIVRMSHDMSPHSNMWEHGPHSSIVAASKHTLWCEGLINVDLIIWCMLKVWHDACRRDKTCSVISLMKHHRKFVRDITFVVYIAAVPPLRSH
jgi:hypothetical protein